VIVARIFRSAADVKVADDDGLAFHACLTVLEVELTLNAVKERCPISFRSRCLPKKAHFLG
jgi:hypothetical protein